MARRTNGRGFIYRIGRSIAQADDGWDILDFGEYVVQTRTLKASRANGNVLGSSQYTLPIPVSNAKGFANIGGNGNTSTVLDWIPRCQIEPSSDNATRVIAYVHSKGGTFSASTVQDVDIVVIGRPL